MTHTTPARAPLMLPHPPTDSPLLTHISTPPPCRNWGLQYVSDAEDYGCLLRVPSHQGLIGYGSMRLGAVKPRLACRSWGFHKAPGLCAWGRGVMKHRKLVQSFSITLIAFAPLLHPCTRGMAFANSRLFTLPLCHPPWIGLKTAHMTFVNLRHALVHAVALATLTSNVLLLLQLWAKV